MNASAILLLTAVLFGLVLTFWPVLRPRLLRLWGETPEEQWHRAEAALQRISERMREDA